MITDKINNSLDALFDIENDALYKSLICDKNGSITEPITIPTDIKLGALTSQVEYLRKLSLGLINQIFIDQAVTEFLTYQLNDFFNSLRLESETDAQWVSRTIATVLSQKVSWASIIYTLRPYSSQEPEISFIKTNYAYADFSYANIYLADLDQFVLPDICSNYDGEYFTIKITLYDTVSSDIYTVYQLISIMIAAGISYILEIITTV